MKSTTKKLTCTWGLPGSGKTTFCEASVGANSYSGYRNRGTTAVCVSYDEMDRYCHGKTKAQAFITRIKEYLSSSINEIYMDTLVTTNEGFANLFNQLDPYGVGELVIQYWLPDRTICMWNDRYRRSEDSVITITNMPFETPDVNQIKVLCPKLKDLKITVVRNCVMHKPEWKMFADKFGIQHKDGIMKSDTWSMGGTSGNCWDNHVHQVSGDTPLASFKEFDSLMETVCPNMSFLQYKRVYNKCVTTDDYSEGDYYGGSITYAYYKCDIQSLYDELVDLNLLTLNEDK